MGNIITSKIFHSVMLFTVVGEFFLPWILCRYYDGYNSKTMAMSALGSLQSPVRVIYNTWLIWLGCFLAFAAVAYFFYYEKRLSNLIGFTVVFTRDICCRSRIGFGNIPCE